VQSHEARQSLPWLTYNIGRKTMTTYLERRWGGGGKNPSEKELRAALAELSTPDEEHPDCWLSDENGWTIAGHQSGKVVLENPESDEGPWHMKKKSPDEVLELWRLLQSGDITAIRAMPWLDGYGGAA
jgi:hypothetical protein